MGEPFQWKLILNKIDVIRHQTTTAIDLFFDDGDPISIHTLIMAAYEITATLCHKQNIPACVKNLLHIIPDEKTKTEFSQHFHVARNYFKHADRDQHSIVSFKPEYNEPIIFDTIYGYQQLTNTLPKKILRIHHVV